MADRALAESLPPIKPFAYYETKYSSPPYNLTGNVLYDKIFEGSLKPNAEVNAHCGIK